MKEVGKRMKRIMVVLIVLSFINGCIGCSVNLKNREAGDRREVKVGVLLYNWDDMFINVMRQNLDEGFRKQEKKQNCKITVNICDAKGSQLLQNDQIEKFIEQNYDVLCVNLVDRTDAASIVDKGKKADIPIVFFNREPVSADMNLWDKTYYVGVLSEEGGSLQGEIIIDQYKKDKTSLDKNGDGVIQYVLLEGEPGHQDTLIRTESCIKTVKDAGIQLERLGTANANWRRNQGKEIMETWLRQFGGGIELVLSNNDAMALGALDTIEGHDIPKGQIAIIGLDGVDEAKAAVVEGRMLGTVVNDAEGQVNSVIRLALYLGLDQKPKDIEYMSENRVVSVPHRIFQAK